MIPTNQRIPTNYATCQPCLVPEPPEDPAIPYLPKLIVCDNKADTLLSVSDVYETIQRTVKNNPCYFHRYHSLTHREVRSVVEEGPIPLIGVYAIPDRVLSDEVRVIFRNHSRTSFSVFSLLPRENRPMAEASSPKSTDGTQAPTSAMASTSTMASTSGLALDQQRYPSLSRPIAYSSHKIHGDTDTINLPYKCNKCSKCYRYETALKSHQKQWHSGEHPYQCKTCGKGCIDRTALERHKDSHSATKKHECHLCDKKYKFRSGLLGHLRTAHNLNKS